MITGFFRNARLLSVTELALHAKDVVLLPLLTRHLGATDFGVWAQVKVLVAVLSPAVMLGIDHAAMRFMPGASAEEKRRGLSTVLTHIVLSTGIISLFLWFFAETWASIFFEKAEYAPFIGLCGFVLLSRRLLIALQNFLRVEDRVQLYAGVNAARSVIATLLVVGVVVLDMDVFDLVLLTTSLEAVLALVLLALMVREGALGRPQMGLEARFLRFGVPLIPVGYAMWITSASDRVFLVHYGELAAVGVYSLVYSLCSDILSVLYKPLWVMYPARAAELYNQGDLQGLERLFRYCTRGALALLAPVAAGLSMVADDVLALLAPPSFGAGAPLIPLVAGAFLLQLLGSYWDVSLRLANRQGLKTLTLGVAAVANLALNGLLIPRYGMLGAAVATAVTLSAEMVFVSVLANRHLPLAFDLRFSAKVVVATMAMVVVVHLVDDPSTVSLVWQIPIGAAVYVVALLAQRALDPRESEAILSLLHARRLMRWRWVRSLTGVRGD